MGSMSGIAGAKGYVFQAFSAVIESLEKKEWSSIRLEHILYDKVDIFWDIKGDGSNIKVSQVKTSINSFKIEIIGDTLTKLMSNFSTADQYELTLIGPADSYANDFLRKINESRKFTTLEEKKWLNLEGTHGKVIVKHYSTDNEDELFKIASENLNRFLEQKRITSSAAQRIFILEALTGAYCLLETSGNYITRTAFEEKILFIYQQCLSIKLNGNYMKIGSPLAVNTHRTLELATEVGMTLSNSGYVEDSELIRSLSIVAADTVNENRMQSYGVNGLEVYNCYRSKPFEKLYENFLKLGIFKNLDELLKSVRSIKDAEKLLGSFCYYAGGLHRKGFNINNLSILPQLILNFSPTIKVEFEYHPSYIYSYTSRSDLTSGAGKRRFLVFAEIKSAVEENNLITFQTRVYLISDPIPENMPAL